METKNKETLEEAYAKLVKAYKKLYEEKSDLEKNIQKAIEYIEKQIHRNQQFYEMDKDNLLEILNSKKWKIQKKLK